MIRELEAIIKAVQHIIRKTEYGNVKVNLKEGTTVSEVLGAIRGALFLYKKEREQ